jgi:hypothetical protein
MPSPRCPQHNVALRCPACTGSEGGKTMTPARTLASRANAVKARAARMRRYAASLEPEPCFYCGPGAHLPGCPTTGAS